MNMSAPKAKAPLRRGLSRLASNVSNKSKECIGVDGKDGHGEQMTP
jgi:hypothetical protein